MTAAPLHKRLVGWRDCRGNHDRSRNGSDWDTCTVVPGTNPTHYDCWGDTFGYRLQQLQNYEVGGLRIVALDTTTLDAAGGTIGAAQLKHVLSKDKDRPTLLFGHHPITYESAATTEAGPRLTSTGPPRSRCKSSTNTPRASSFTTADTRTATSGPSCWTASRTRGRTWSSSRLYPQYMLGTIVDRNHTVTRDLSGLTSLG